MNIKKGEPDNMKIPFFSRKGKHEHKTLKEGKTITDIRCDSIHSPVLQKKFNRITCLLPVFKSPHRLSVCLHLSKSRLFHFPDTIMGRVSMSMAGPVLVSLRVQLPGGKPENFPFSLAAGKWNSGIFRHFSFSNLKIQKYL